MSFTDPLGLDRLAQLKALHLYGMATAWSELLSEGPRRPVQPEAWLDRLIQAELADRQIRSLRYQFKAARFPVHRDLTGIDWAETPLPQGKIEQLASAAFMQTAHNLILVGGTGTGKSHFATALGEAGQGSSGAAGGMPAEGWLVCTKASVFASTTPSIWSTNWRRKSSRAKLGTWPGTWFRRTQSSSMNLAICRSRHQGAPCCSI